MESVIAKVRPRGAYCW